MCVLFYMDLYFQTGKVECVMVMIYTYHALLDCPAITPVFYETLLGTQFL